MDRIIIFVLAGLICAFPLACGDDDDDNGNGGTMDAGADTATGERDTCAPSDTDTTVGLPVTAKAVIRMPDGFDGDPVEMRVSFTERLAPPGQQSMPSGLGATVKCFEIGPDNTYEIETFAIVLMGGGAPLVGDYYFSVLLYVEGGGAGAAIPIPVGNVDFSGTSSTPATIDPEGAVADFGEIEMELWPEGIEVEFEAGVDTNSF